MNISTLRHFVVLAETLHFGEAARRLHMTQPPLSRQIAALEKSLDVALFERHSRSVRLTPAGESFYQDCKRLLDEYEAAIRTAQSVARGEKGELRIGFTMCAAWSVLPNVLSRFTAAYPDVSVTLSETLPKDLPGALSSGEIDIGISFPAICQHPIQYTHIFQEPLCAVLPLNHPLAATKTLSASDLSNEGFISFPQQTSPELHQAFLKCCHSHHFEPDIQLETHLQQTIVNLVATGLGVALVPDSMRRMRLEGATFVTLKQSPIIEQAVFWNENNANPCMRGFLEVLPTNEGLS